MAGLPAESEILAANSPRSLVPLATPSALGWRGSLAKTGAFGANPSWRDTSNSARRVAGGLVPNDDEQARPRTRARCAHGC